MPIHDLGYRGWQGKTHPTALRWQAMAEVGVKQAWTILAVRRWVIVAVTPVLVGALSIFFIEQAMHDPILSTNISRVIRQWPNAATVSEALTRGQDARHVLWSYTLMMFLRYPQGAAMMVLVGVIGPPLISRDVRNRAFLLYFSRPLGQLQYILGKASVLVFYLLLISAIPGIVVYLVGVLLSPSLGVIWQTWDLPLRVILASIAMIVPATSFMLCLSSLTSESRNAGFAWYGVWVLGFIAYINLATVQFSVQNSNVNNFRDLNFNSPWTLVSPYHMIGRVQAWVLGIEPITAPQVLGSFLMLSAVSIVSLIVLFRRVSAPIRI